MEISLFLFEYSFSYIFILFLSVLLNSVQLALLWGSKKIPFTVDYSKSQVLVCKVADVFNAELRAGVFRGDINNRNTVLF